MKIMRQPELYFGKNSIDNLSDILSRLNTKKVMIVTTHGRVKSEAFRRICDLLNVNNIELILWDKVQPEPTIEQVIENVDFARNQKIDAVIGFGGGSPIDTAKIVGALITNKKDLHDYIGSELIEEESIPIIAIPTTAGTGSEVTHAAVMSDTENKTKCVIASTKIIPHFAILDPNLTVNLPNHVTAYTGMDALTHAIEAYFSPNSNKITNTFAENAIELIFKNIISAHDMGSNIEARQNMLLGSYMAGIAFANAGVAAVHAFGYPLGVLYHIPHGMVNSVLLTPILEFNVKENEEKFISLAKLIDSNSDDPYFFVDKVKRLSDRLNISQQFKQYGVSMDSVEEMSNSVMKITRLLDNNPSIIKFEDAIKIYSKII